MNKVISLVESQPARMYFYPAVLGVVAYLVSRGTLDHDTADWISSIVAAVVGIGATESVHAAVRPKSAPQPQIEPPATPKV